MLNKSRVALFFGAIFGFVHLVWAILVATGFGQILLGWIMNLHFIDMTFTVLKFDFVKMLELVALTFLVGLVGGYILASLWNIIVGKKK